MWTQQMETLSKFAITQPHASHAAYVHGLSWSYCQSTMKKVKDLMRPLEAVIREKFIPNLLDEKTPISDEMRKLYALPGRFNGLGLDNPIEDATPKYDESVQLTKQLANLLVAGESKLLIDEEQLQKTKKEIKEQRNMRHKTIASALRAKFPRHLQKAMDVAQEKGGSCIITTLPLEKYDLAFKSKRDFRDLLRMRYRNGHSETTSDVCLW